MVSIIIDMSGEYGPAHISLNRVLIEEGRLYPLLPYSMASATSGQAGLDNSFKSTFEDPNSYNNVLGYLFFMKIIETLVQSKNK